MVGLLGYAAAGALAGAGDAMVSEGKARREAALEALRQKNSLELEDRRSQNSYNNESKLQNEKATLEGTATGFSGNSMDAQAANILMGVQQGTISPDDPRVAIAQQLYTEGKYSTDPATGAVIRIPRPLPFGKGSANSPASTSSQALPQGDATAEEMDRMAADPNPPVTDLPPEILGQASGGSGAITLTAGKPQAPLSTAGKLEEDLRNGRISQEIYDAEIAKQGNGRSLESYTIPPEAKELGIEKGIKAGTGVFPRIASSLDAVQGSVTGGALGNLNPEQQKGQKQIKFLREVIVPSFANSPRFPEGEMKRIQQNLTIQDDWIQNPAAAAGKARELYSLIRSSYLPRVINSIKDPNTTETDRSSLVQQYNAMIQAMRFMENPNSVMQKKEMGQSERSGQSYSSPEDVRSAFQSGQIDRETARQLIQQMRGGQ